jgi:hypothetical protein
MGDADFADTGERGADLLRMAHGAPRARPRKDASWGGGVPANFLLRQLGTRRSPLSLLRRESPSRPAGPDNLELRQDGWDGLERRRTKAKCFLGVARQTRCATRSGSAPRSLVSARSASPMQSNPSRRDAPTPRTNHGPWTMDHGQLPDLTPLSAPAPGRWPWRDGLERRQRQRRRGAVLRRRRTGSADRMGGRRRASTSATVSRRWRRRGR